MRKVILILFLGFVSILVNGQDNTVTLEEYFRQAVSDHKSRKYDSAIEKYSKILELNIDNETNRQILIKRGLAYNGLKKFDLAIIDFTKSIELNKTDMASFIDRGLAYFYNNEYDKAEIDFKHVITKGTNKRMSENARYWLVKIEFNRNNYNKAITYCNQIIKENKSDPEFYFLRATAYSNLLDYKNAIKNYDSAIKIKPN